MGGLWWGGGVGGGVLLGVGLGIVLRGGLGVGVGGFLGGGRGLVVFCGWVFGGGWFFGVSFFCPGAEVSPNLHVLDFRLFPTCLVSSLLRVFEPGLIMPFLEASPYMAFLFSPWLSM